MNQTELIRVVAEVAEVKKSEAAHVLKTLAEVIEANLVAEGAIALPGLGKLLVRSRGARIGRNPRTGEKITIPSGRHVAFAPTTALKAAVRLP